MNTLLAVWVRQHSLESTLTVISYRNLNLVYGGIISDTTLVARFLRHQVTVNTRLRECPRKELEASSFAILGIGRSGGGGHLLTLVVLEVEGEFSRLLAAASQRLISANLNLNRLGSVLIDKGEGSIHTIRDNG